MKTSLDTLALILNLGPQNLGHVQLPVPQTNTTPHAVLKHKRSIEDTLMASGLESSGLGLHLCRPADAHASDRRGCLQPCLAVASEAKACVWTPPVLVGPLELVRVADMLGYESDQRPGATARAEQPLCQTNEVKPTLCQTILVLVFCMKFCYAASWHQGKASQSTCPFLRHTFKVCSWAPMTRWSSLTFCPTGGTTTIFFQTRCLCVERKSGI